MSVSWTTLQRCIGLAKKTKKTFGFFRNILPNFLANPVFYQILFSKQLITDTYKIPPFKIRAH